MIQHLLLVATPSVWSETIVAFAARLGLVSVQTQHLAQGLQLMQQHLPPLVVVQMDGEIDDAAQFVRDCRAIHPLVRVLLVCPGCSVVQLLALVESGATDVLPGDENASEVCDAVAIAHAQFQRWLQRRHRLLAKA